MNQSKSLFKIIVAGVILLPIIILGPIMLVRQVQKQNKEKTPITTSALCLFHNTAGINASNCLEYTNQLALFSEDEEVEVRLSALNLLQVNKNIASSEKSQKIKEVMYKRSIHKIIQASCKAIGFEAYAEAITKNFVADNGNCFFVNFFHENEEGIKSLDKALRLKGHSLPSPIFLGQDFLKRTREFVVKAEEGIEGRLEGYFTDPWLVKLISYLPGLYEEMGLSPEEFIHTVAAYYICQFYILFHIHEADAMLDFVRIAQKYKELYMNKDEKLAEGYAAKRADLISLQEASTGTIKQLYKNHDYVIGDEDKLYMEKAGNFGSINLYKKSFIEENHYTITKLCLVREDVERYRKEVSTKNFQKLFGNEVNINHLENDKHSIVHISFHADSAGSNSIAFLYAAFDLIDGIKQSSAKPVYVIMGMDGNFTIKGTRGKQDLAEARGIIEKAGYKLVEYVGGDTNTTKKERSYMQGQNGKKGKVAEEQSDIVVVSDNVKLVNTFLSAYTKLSDHREIGANIALQAG